MNPFIDEVKAMLDEMESVISNDFDNTQKLADLYYQIKDSIQDIHNNTDIDDEQVFESESQEINRIVKRFEFLSNQFDNPDDIEESEMKGMFPDGNALEGYDWVKE